MRWRCRISRSLSFNMTLWSSIEIFLLSVNLQLIRTTGAIEIHFQRSASTPFIKRKMDWRNSHTLTVTAVVMRQYPNNGKVLRYTLWYEWTGDWCVFYSFVGVIGDWIIYVIALSTHQSMNVRSLVWQRAKFLNITTYYVLLSINWQCNVALRLRVWDWWVERVVWATISRCWM